MPVDLAAALDRLLALPEIQRAIVLARHPAAIGEKDHRIYADFVRNHLAERDQSKAIIAPIMDMAWDEGFTPVSKYLETIVATSGERAACVEKAASERFLCIAMDRNVTQQDFDELRELAKRWTPDATNRLTGATLATVMRYGGQPAGKLSFDDAAEITIRYGESSGYEAIIATFLEDSGLELSEVTLSVAQRISNETMRREVIEELQQRSRAKERNEFGKLRHDR